MGSVVDGVWAGVDVVCGLLTVTDFGGVVFAGVVVFGVVVVAVVVVGLPAVLLSALCWVFAEASTCCLTWAALSTPPALVLLKLPEELVLTEPTFPTETLPVLPLLEIVPAVPPPETEPATAVAPPEDPPVLPEAPAPLWAGTPLPA